MKMTKHEEEARSLLEEAVERLTEQDDRIQALAEDTPQEERDFHQALFDKYEEEVERRRETLTRLIAIRKARETIPPDPEERAEEEYRNATGGKPAVGLDRRIRVTVGDEAPTYRPDAPFSFYRDMYMATKGDEQADARLRRHQLETRDVTTADPGAGVFLPPQYLANMWAALPRESRPFADILPTLPLPDTGLNVTVPRVTTGTSVAVQAAEADAPSETDIDGTLLTVNVRTIAGQQDLSVQAFERTLPGMDVIVFNDLRADYDSKLDSQLLSGAGTLGTHLGIRAVTGRNTVTYTAATPTASGALPKIYDAIQQIADGRKMRADSIVMHPRRAAWFASNLSSTFPLFQLGVLTQAAGSQQAGFVDNFAGLRVVLDSNIGTTYGTGTNEDEIYVVRTADLMLMEGTITTAVYEQVLSGTLQVRLQLRAYSAFMSGRQPEAIGHISGTGLAAPTF